MQHGQNPMAGFIELNLTQRFILRCDWHCSFDTLHKTDDDYCERLLLVMSSMAEDGIVTPVHCQGRQRTAMANVIDLYGKHADFSIL